MNNPMFTVIARGRTIQGTDLDELTIQADGIILIEKSYVDRAYGLDGWG